MLKDKDLAVELLELFGIDSERVQAANFAFDAHGTTKITVVYAGCKLPDGMCIPQIVRNYETKEIN